MPIRYQCADCSFTGPRFKQGRCPACGSANTQSDAPEQDTGKRRGPIGLIVCCVLWIYLGYEIVLRVSG